MRSMQAATAAALSQPVVRMAMMARIQFRGGGQFAFNTMQKNITWQSVTYLGIGNIGEISPVDETADGSPANYRLTLSGLDPALVSGINRADYLNHTVTTWLLVLDENHNVIGDPVHWWSGLTDRTSITLGKRAAITIDVKDRRVLWQNPHPQYWTDQAQRRRDPTDRGMEQVASLDKIEIEWPKGVRRRVG